MISRTQLISKCVEAGRSATPQRMSIIDELCSSKGVVHKMDSSNTYLVCNDNHTNHFHVLLHCTSCKSVQESCQLSAQLSLPNSNQFAVNDSQAVEINGVCNKCQ